MGSTRSKNALNLHLGRCIDFLPNPSLLGKIEFLAVNNCWPTIAVCSACSRYFIFVTLFIFKLGEVIAHHQRSDQAALAPTAQCLKIIYSEKKNETNRQVFIFSKCCINEGQVHALIHQTRKRIGDQYKECV
jgi:hypothetical protein